MRRSVFQERVAGSNGFGHTLIVDDVARRWVERSTGAPVRAVRPLRRGDSEVTAVDVGDDPHRRALVLRRVVDADWLAREPDLAAREAATLEALAPTPVPAPRLVAVDPIGDEAGAPAVLTTRLGGEPTLPTTVPGSWFDEFHRVLSIIHDTSPWPGLQPYRLWYADRLPAPVPWSRTPAAWARAAAVVAGGAPDEPAVLIHRDFNPFNVLWSGDRVSGVVDWVEASVGSAGVDLGHCRVNLALEVSLEAADALLAPVDRYDSYWDLASAVSFVVDWDAERVDAAARARLDALVERALAGR